MTKYLCKECGQEFEIDGEVRYKDGEDAEEDMWGHIQIEHEEIFDEVVDLGTPDMIALCYDRVFELQDALEDVLLDDLCELVHCEEDGVPLTLWQKEKYVLLVDILRELNIEIPFGIEI